MKASIMRASRLILPAVVVAAAALAWRVIAPFSGSAGGSEVLTLPANLSAADPDVVALIREAAANVDADPSLPQAWRRFAMICHANGFPGSAIEAYQGAIGLSSADARTWYLLAVAQHEQGNADAALDSMKHAATLDPTHVDAHWRLGYWLLDHNDLGGAEQAFSSALKLEAASIPALIGAARVQLQQRRASDAAGILEELVRSRPTFGHARYLLGQAYRQLEREDDARKQIAGADPTAPEWPDAWLDELSQFRVSFAAMMMRAEGLMAQGDFRGALQLLEPLRKKHPKDDALANNIAIALLSTGDPARSIELLRESLARNPNYFPTHQNLAAAYGETGDFTVALEHADKAIELNPTMARSYALKAALLRRLNRDEEAAAAYEQMCRYDRSNPGLLTELAKLEIRLERWSSAEAHLEQALAIQPDFAEAVLGMGLVHLRFGRAAQAESALRHAKMLMPGDPRVDAAIRRLENQAGNGGVKDAR